MAQKKKAKKKITKDKGRDSLTEKSTYAKKVDVRRKLSGKKGYHSINKGDIKKLPIPLCLFQDA